MNPAQVLDLVRTVFGWALQFVPHEELSKALTEEAVKRQNALADAAEAAKFGTG